MFRCALTLLAPRKATVATTSKATRKVAAVKAHAPPVRKIGAAAASSSPPAKVSNAKKKVISFDSNSTIAIRAKAAAVAPSTAPVTKKKAKSQKASTKKRKAVAPSAHPNLSTQNEEDEAASSFVDLDEDEEHLYSTWSDGAAEKFISNRRANKLVLDGQQQQLPSSTSVGTSSSPRIHLTSDALNTSSGSSSPTIVSMAPPMPARSSAALIDESFAEEVRARPVVIYQRH